jgi:hypothetical protein
MIRFPNASSRSGTRASAVAPGWDAGSYATENGVQVRPLSREEATRTMPCMGTASTVVPPTRATSSGYLG